jgi:hypothetical protein
MSRPDYKSFESNDLHMSNLSSDEAEVVTLLATDAKDVTESTARGNRKRFISIVSVVLAIVGVSLLVSFSNGPTQKGTSAKVVADMHTFESISAGRKQYIIKPTKIPVVTTPTSIAFRINKPSRKKFDQTR